MAVYLQAVPKVVARNQQTPTHAAAYLMSWHPVLVCQHILQRPVAQLAYVPQLPLSVEVVTTVFTCPPYLLGHSK